MAVLFRSMGCGGREVGVRRKLGRPDQLLLLLWQVAREARDAVGAQPDPPAVGLDVGEDVADRELVLLALRGLVLVRRERGDIDQPGDPVIGSRRGDHGSAVGVADQDGRAAHPAQRAAHGRDVTVERVEAVLAGNHLVAVRLQGGDHLAEARPVGPDPVDEDDAWLGLRHEPLPSDVPVPDAPERASSLSGDCSRCRSPRHRSNEPLLIRRRTLISPTCLVPRGLDA
jgi:hypothetical protein